MDVFPLLDELQTIARNGLTYATNPFDRERYRRLLELVSTYYGQVLDLPAAEVGRRLSAELGYITAKVGANAAIFDHQGRILLMLRVDDEKWCLPCGWVEPNESPSETAVREAKEECGLDIRPVQLVDVIARKPSVENGPHTAVAVIYLCEVIGGTLELSHEGKDLRYWRIEETPSWHRLHRQYALAARAVWQARQTEGPQHPATR
jgi:ADP-ribose pyrophosphatase YjhB (NUDIX family)